MALVLCVGLTACTDAKGKETEETKTSVEQQTQTGSEEGSQGQQGGTEQVTTVTELGPEVALLQDYNYGTYYALDKNGNKVAEYHYYQEEYTSEGGQSYRAEFIFQPDGTNGFIVYLYVYLEKDHLDDVMIFLRMVEP